MDDPKRVARWTLALLVPLLMATVATRHVVLNGDIAYAFGGLRSASEGGAGGPADIFIARPMAYRLLVSLLDHGRALVTDDASSLLAQRVIRVETVLLVAVVAVLLYLGLRRHMSPARSLFITYAVGVTLTIAPPFHLLEPDWVGALVAVAAIGGALAPKRLVIGGIAGGVLLWLTVAMKVATAPWAVLAVGVIALFSRRRATVAGSVAAGLIAAWMLLTWLFMYWEWIWVRDMVDLVDSSPLSHGLRAGDLIQVVRGVIDVAVLFPVVVALPAALAVLILDRPRQRILTTSLAVCGLALSVGSAYGQGEWFQYHFSGIPVLAAGFWAAALTSTKNRISWWILVVSVLSAGVASACLMAAPVAWRHDHADAVAVAYVALSCLCVAAVILGTSGARLDRPMRTGVIGLAVSTIAVCLSATVAGLPGSSLAFDTYNASLTNRAIAQGLHTSRQQYAELHRHLRKDMPVLYLTYGAENYLMGNPTPCRYPSPQWLQRSTYLPYVRDFESYRDNARCVTDDSTAEALVVDPQWFKIERLEPRLRSRLKSRFDCSPEKQIRFGRPNVYICPRRL